MLKELREKLRKLLADIKAVQDKYDGKAETFTPDEEEKIDEMLADVDKVQAEIKRLERIDSAAQFAGQIVDPEVPIGASGVKADTADELKQAAYDIALKSYLSNGDMQLTPAEKKDLALYTATTGGYIATPGRFMAELIATAKKDTVMRNICRVLPPLTDTTSLGAPSLDTDISDPSWTGENSTITFDSDLAFGQRELKPNFLKLGAKISKHLFGRTVLNPEAIVQDRFQYKFNLKTENGYLNGSGQGQPLGVFTASNDGVSTGRDFTTASSLTVAPDDVIDMFHSVRPAYRSRGVWVASDDFFRSLRKAKDSANHYVWQPFDFPGQQLVGANPGLIMGRPYYTSELVTGMTTNAWAANTYVAVFGDFQYYWIVDCAQFEIMVDPYSDMQTMKNRYYGVAWSDGMPVLEEAFERLKIKA